MNDEDFKVADSRPLKSRHWDLGLGNFLNIIHNNWDYTVHVSVVDIEMPDPDSKEQKTSISWLHFLVIIFQIEFAAFYTP